MKTLPPPVDLAPTDGLITVSSPDQSGAAIASIGADPFFPAPVFLVLGTGSLQIDFAFEELISAVGFDYFIPELVGTNLSVADISLSLFDEDDNQLSFLNIAAAEQPPCPVDFEPFASCGFLGLNAGGITVKRAQVNYSFIDSLPSDFDPANGELTLVTDNIIYQQVPTPGIFWLINIGLLALAWDRKRNAS